MSKVVWKIKDCFGKEIKIIPELFLYEVSDYMGRKTNIPGIQLYTEIIWYLLEKYDKFMFAFADA